jgi:hypothetical protein
MVAIHKSFDECFCNLLAKFKESARAGSDLQAQLAGGPATVDEDGVAGDE